MFEASPNLPMHLPILPPAAPRVYDPKDPDPCRGCSDCCEYISVGLDAPRSRKDFDELFWFLLHENVWVFVDEPNDWYVQFNTRCGQLKQQRCGIYTRRPKICRNYSPEDCTTYAEGDPHKHLFKTPEDLFEYLRIYRPKTHARLKKYYEGRFPLPSDNAREGATAGPRPGAACVA